MRNIVRAAVAAGSIIAVGSVVSASVPDAAGLIHGCINDATRVVRIIDTAKPGKLGQCITTSGLLHETPVSWNHTGPAGSPGQRGEAGPQGEVGPQGPPGSAAAVEQVRMVGTVGQPGFGSCVSFGRTTEWAHLSGFDYNPVGFYKDPLGVVHLSGLAGASVRDHPTSKPECETGQQFRLPIFVLPDGYRPVHEERLGAVYNDGFGQVAIKPTGEVIAMFPPPQLVAFGLNWTSLDGLSFRVP